MIDEDGNILDEDDFDDLPENDDFDSGVDDEDDDISGIPDDVRFGEEDLFPEDIPDDEDWDIPDDVDDGDEYADDGDFLMVMMTYLLFDFLF